MIYNFKQMDISIIFRNIMALLFVFFYVPVQPLIEASPEYWKETYRGCPRKH
jgi:hypothetical protein